MARIKVFWSYWTIITVAFGMTLQTLQKLKKQNMDGGKVTKMYGAKAAVDGNPRG